MTTKQALQLYHQAGAEPPAELAGTPAPSKYHARKKEVDGHLFDSTGEALAYRKLRLWEHAGVISDLQLQPRFVISPGYRDAEGHKVRAREYVADFSFMRGGRRVIVDFKGVLTPMYRMKRDIFRQRFPDLEFEEWTKKDLS